MSANESFMSYEELLERSYSLLPRRRRRSQGERFVLPTFEASKAGKKVYIHNFKDVADILNRDPPVLLRFILKEVALPGVYENGVAVIHGEVAPQTLNRLLERFYNEYVKCPVCNAPDTFLVKEKRFMYIKCMACGAVSPVKPF
ncbi:MAG: translation initiation factor IF-2 subunit beta [Thermofilum sp.]|nr:translation initiation factor IF-2 subunit beta [Thermofilum sp.]